MARKVFISFLGTNNYVECHYDIAGKVSPLLRFIQEALIRHHCTNWTETDRIFIFCTEGKDGSETKNWLDAGHNADSIGLEHRLTDLREKEGLKPSIEMTRIPAGFTETEIWSIFETVYSKLMPGDEIYFDVTHALRSIPIFSIVLFNYAKFMKNTHLVLIQYGAFEKLGPAKYVEEKIPKDERIAPVLDLTGIARLQEYTQIASELKNFGRVGNISKVIGSGHDSGENELIEKMKDSTSKLDEYITTINLEEIKKGEYVKLFQQSNGKLQKAKSLSVPLRNILNELKKEMNEFVEQESYKNVEAAIKWTLKHNMLIQAFLLTEEYIITRICDRFHISPSKDKKANQEYIEKRKVVSGVLGCNQQVFYEKRWNFEENYYDLGDDIAEDQLVKSIRGCYNAISKARNALAHANPNNRGELIGYQELKNRTPKIKECLDLIRQQS